MPEDDFAMSADDYSFSNLPKESETVFCKNFHEEKCSQVNGDRMKDLYCSSLTLVEQEVAEGNTQTALAYLETYHLCQLIERQSVNLKFSSFSQKTENENLIESNENSFLQNLQVLLEPQDLKNNSNRS